MKSRAIQYFRKAKARKVIQRPAETDLNTFLKATLELAGSHVVKRHIRNTIQQLNGYASQLMTA